MDLQEQYDCMLLDPLDLRLSAFKMILLIDLPVFTTSFTMSVR